MPRRVTCLTDGTCQGRANLSDSNLCTNWYSMRGGYRRSAIGYGRIYCSEKTKKSFDQAKSNFEDVGKSLGKLSKGGHAHRHIDEKIKVY